MPHSSRVRACAFEVTPSLGALIPPLPCLAIAMCSARTVSSLCLGPGQQLHVPLRRGAGGHRRVGILVRHLVEAEAAEAHDPHGVDDRRLVAPEETCHLGPALEVALGVGRQRPVGLRHGDPVLDRGQHVLQGPEGGHVVVRVVGSDEGGLVPLGQRCEAIEPALVVAPVEQVGREVEGAPHGACAAC